MQTPEKSSFPWTEGGKAILDRILTNIENDPAYIMLVIEENSKGYERRKAPYSRPNVAYTGMDINMLIKNYGKKSLPVLAHEMGRSPQAIKAFVARLRSAGVKIEGYGERS